MGIGLFVEVVFAFAYRHGAGLVETWTPVLADALITAGVFGEVHFAGRISREEEVLRQKSEEKVAEANKSAADARERTAMLEQLTGWRKFTQDQFNSLVANLRAIGVPFRPIIEYERGDPEAYSFVYQLAQVLTKAGGGSFHTNANSYQGNGVFGILFATGPDIDTKLIWDAFSAVGIGLTPTHWDFSRYTRPDGLASNIYFFVAPKPPPIFVFSGEVITAEGKTDSTVT